MAPVVLRQQWVLASPHFLLVRLHDLRDGPCADLRDGTCADLRGATRAVIRDRAGVCGPCAARGEQRLQLPVKELLAGWHRRVRRQLLQGNRVGSSGGRAGWLPIPLTTSSLRAARNTRRPVPPLVRGVPDRSCRRSLRARSIKLQFGRSTVPCHNSNVRNVRAYAGNQHFGLGTNPADRGAGQVGPIAATETTILLAPGAVSEYRHSRTRLRCYQVGSGHAAGIEERHGPKTFRVACAGTPRQRPAGPAVSGRARR